MNTQLTVTATTHSLMAKTFARHTIGLPFGRDIFLIETHVAGLPYHQATLALPTLAVGTPLSLRREPSNAHDALAIEVVTAHGLKLGYLPRSRNPVLARLMDGGKHLVAAIVSIGADARYTTDAQPDIRLSIALRE
jgi:hypothetical protein